MPRIKSALIFLLIIVLLLSATACGETNAGASSSPSESASAEPSVSESEEPSPSESEEPSESPSESDTASASPSASKSKDYESFSGFLLDVKCGKAGKDTKGHSMKTHPEKHTVKCLKDKTHAASGYGIAMKRKDGTYKFYKFDEAGSKKIKHFIVDKTVLKDNVLVAVRGSMKDNIIYVDQVLAYGLK